MSAAAKQARKREIAAQTATRTAVAAERERCSDIAEGYAKGALNNGMVVHAEVARTIAAAIRGEPRPAA